MTAHDLLHMTLALMRDADVSTEEKLAVLEAAAIVVRDTAGLDEALRLQSARLRDLRPVSAHE
jgi:hypothetical protein